MSNSPLKKEEILDNEELEDILFANSQEVCGLYMGDFYEEPTRIMNPQIEELVEQFKFLKDFYMKHA